MTTSHSLTMRGLYILHDVINQNLNPEDQKNSSIQGQASPSPVQRLIHDKLNAHPALYRTGFSSIERNRRATSINNEFIVKVNENSGSADEDSVPYQVVERSESEVALHILLESHFQAQSRNGSKSLDVLSVENVVDYVQRVEARAPDQDGVDRASAGTGAAPELGSSGYDDASVFESSAAYHRVALPAVVEQIGHTCKTTALGNIDRHFAAQHNIAAIPVNKNSKKNRVADSTNQSATETGISIRRLAKYHRSRQGEILNSTDLCGIASDLGYTSEILSPTNLQDFRSLVVQCIQRNLPLTTCFAVNRRTGLPDRRYEDNEHACVICGIDQEADTLDIAHWGAVFTKVPIADMFAFMNSLPDTREQEFYARTAAHDRGEILKYRLTDADFTSERSDDFLPSIIPEENSGFKNKVFLFCPDLSHSRWLPTPG